MSNHVGKWLKTTEHTSPDSIVLRLRPANVVIPLILRLDQSISIVFHRGGSRPKVVVQNGPRCVQWPEIHWADAIPSTKHVCHIRSCSGTPLLVLRGYGLNTVEID